MTITQRFKKWRAKRKRTQTALLKAEIKHLNNALSRVIFEREEAKAESRLWANRAMAAGWGKSE